MNDADSMDNPPGPEVVPAPPEPSSEPPGYLWRPIERTPPPLQLVPEPPPPRLIPNLGHVLVFILLLIPALIGGYLVALFSIYATHPHVPLRSLMEQIGRNVIFAISLQAAIYIVLWALAALVFTLWWDRPFAKGIHWNAATAAHWSVGLACLGVATGLGITLAGNFLPMPKAPPILEDLTKSAAGAWTLMAFGVTLAPLTEELAFRGFLLPSLINACRWLQRRHIVSDATVRTFGIPIAIVLTSIPFALMHAQQVSDSWGPVLLIGCVSIILCIIRLATDSVAAGVVVHCAYNLTLFSGLLIQTDWFRHLDKLKM